jgi:YD repeat-containing protein
MLACRNRINTSGYTYDAAGNLTTEGTGFGTHTYQWDAEGRLKSVDNGSTLSFVYNGLGQRVAGSRDTPWVSRVLRPFGSSALPW